jgi:hypothetical protein
MRTCFQYILLVFIGWNLLNTHKVPFVKMWSKYLVPMPKDWGPHVDVVGFFLDKGKAQDRKTSDEPLKSIKSNNPTTASTSTSTSSSSPSNDVASPAPLIVPDTCSYQPSEALRAFLDNGPPPVFVGFGSMVVENAASLIQVSYYEN